MENVFPCIPNILSLFLKAGCAENPPTPPGLIKVSVSLTQRLGGLSGAAEQEDKEENDYNDKRLRRLYESHCDSWRGGT